MKRRNISRRNFLYEGACAAIGGTTLLNTLVNLAMTNTIAARPALFNNDYKALVCILLAGGNDSFNMLVPAGQSEYDEYAATRTTLALQQSSLLPINPNTPDGKSYGVHPSFSGVRDLFEAGNLAFVANAGSLIEPIMDNVDYDNKQRPVGLYSHSDQQHHWQTSMAHDREALGWGGRMAEILHTMNENQNISMNISLNGRNIFQSSNTLLEYTISNDNNGGQGLQTFSRGGNGGYVNYLRDIAIDNLVAETYNNIFKVTYANQMRTSFEAQELFTSSIANVAPFNTVFSNTRLSEDLEMVAKTIAAQAALGMSRQTFFVSIGGWDNHGELLNTQAENLETVNDALVEFYAALQELGMENNVTAFTISDFARTLTTNGNGSDHAWGGNQIVMGGAVNGKDIYGTYPDLYLTDNPLNVSSRGNLIPTTSTDELFAELALWYGVPTGQLQFVLPNITNFWDPNSPNLPLGLMQIT